MTHDELFIGTTYVVYHNYHWYNLKLEAIGKVKVGKHQRTRYYCVNIATGHGITLKSVAKFKRAVA